MAYIVTWKKQPGDQIIRDEIYNDLDKALSEAEVMIAGPFSVEITVADEFGKVLRTVVSGGRSN